MRDAVLMCAEVGGVAMAALLRHRDMNGLKMELRAIRLDAHAETEQKQRLGLWDDVETRPLQGASATAAEIQETRVAMNAAFDRTSGTIQELCRKMRLLHARLDIIEERRAPE